MVTAQMISFSSRGKSIGNTQKERDGDKAICDYSDVVVGGILRWSLMVPRQVSSSLPECG